jgi:MFS transporter, ACS family, hexuronate transporter
MKFKWVVLTMLFVACAISYMDRAALSVAAPLMAKDLNLNPAELGIVFSTFFVGYALFCFIGGYAADRIGPRNVLIVSMSIWSVFCGLTGAVFGFASLLVVRVIFGAGEGPLATSANKMIGSWFERDKQTTAVGLANTGLHVGGALSGPVVGILALSFGWRVSFIVIAALGIAWVILWAALATDCPQDNRWVKPAAGGDAVPAAKPVEAAMPLGAYLRSPQILATAFAYFGYAYILYFFLTWFPSYLTMAQHLSLASMSFVNVIPWVFGAVGMALGGWLSDLIFRWTGNPVLARKIVIVGGLLVASACVAIAGQAASVELAVTLMAITVFSMNITLSPYWGIILDTVAPAQTGSVGGFMHFIANTAGIIAPALTGFLVQWTNNFTSAFLLSGGVALGGALMVTLLVKSKPEGTMPRRRPSGVATVNRFNQTDLETI